MSTALLESTTVKTRKRPAVRTAARPAVSKTKVTLCLEAENATRLAVFAAMTSQERSTIVDQLIRDHLKRFRVQDLARPDAVPDNREDRQSNAA